MKVVHRNNKNIPITGELVTRLDGIVKFSPESAQYGPESILMHDCSIAISSIEDDNCIMVKGYRQHGDLFKSELLCFYPVIK